MNVIVRSPRITSFSWGKVEVEKQGSFKDVKLFPGGARAWDWGETGTEHTPGIQLADVEELLEHGAEVVVLTQGVLGQLNVMPETIAALEGHGITVHVMKTKQAVVEYNRLAQTKPVGCLLHSTC
jgi:hypothetical protein